MQDVFLKANDAAYRRLARAVERLSPKDPDSVLQAIATAAFSAAEFHPGRFADGAIENRALEIGSKLEEDNGDASNATRSRGDRRRVLHVATHVAEIGGHTRTLFHWARKDASSSHSLVITHQEGYPIPAWLISAFEQSGGEVVSLPAIGLSEKARQLRAVAKRNDVVMLHHYPSDVVPTVALATPSCPPVAVVNMADHQFWLGSAVADAVICLRSVASGHSRDRRFLPTSAILPIPLEDLADPPARVKAREALESAGQLMLLTVGRGEKYRPCGPYDFLATAGKMLERNATAHIYVVGEDLNGIAPYAREPIHDRLHFLGQREDSSIYRAAADLYLESYPFGSNTALQEAALSGLAIVPACGPMVPMLVAGDDSLSDLIANPPTEEDYIDRVEYLIHRPEERARLGQQMRRRLLENNAGDGWLAWLAATYRLTDALKHTPKPIPVTDCAASPWDISLSVWHARADGENLTSDLRGRGVTEVLRHSAYVARVTDCHGAALRFSIGAVGASPLAKESWRVLGRSLLRGAKHHLRRFRALKYLRQAGGRAVVWKNA